MAEVASAFVSLMPSAKGFGRSTERQIGGELNSSGKRLGGSFGRAMFGAAALVGSAVGIGHLLSSSLGEAREAQKVGALTNQVIKTTGGVANVTAKHVGNLATAISNKAGIDDEAIQSGANLLLTFKNVRNEAGKGNKVFDRATKAAVDLSAAGFGALSGTSKQLGKALNDPVKGVSALGRAGVTFTEQQKAQIKTLVESGHTLKAQKIVLKEVESQVGGAAAATATSGEKASVAFGNLKEQLGTALLPVVDKLANVFTTTLAPALSSFIDSVGPTMSKIAPVFTQVGTAISGAFSSFTSSGTASSLLTTFTSIGQSIVTNFLPVLSTMSNTFTTSILPAITSLVQYLAANLMPIFQQVAGIITGNVLPILASLATFFYGKVYPAVVAIVQVIATNLKPVFDQLFASIQSQILPAVQRLLAKFQQWQPTLQRVAMIVLQVVGFVLKLASAILGKVLPVVIRFAAFLIGKLLGAIGAVIGIIVGLVKGVISIGKAFVNAVRFADRFGDGVRRALGKVVTLFTGLPGKIKSALSGAGSWLVDTGKDIVHGLISGIGKLKSAVTDALLALIPGPLKKFAGKLGIASPSKVFARFGEALPEGLAQGIRKGGNKAHKALQELADKLTERFQSLSDSIANVASGVADAFRPDLFTGTLSNLISSLSSSLTKLPNVLGAMQKLTSEGIGGQFLQQLFASGNSDLILQLASGSAAQVQQMQSQFNAIQSLTGQIGQQIANKTPEAAELVKVHKELIEIKKELKTHPAKNGRETANALNTTAAAAKRRHTKGA
jgi:hypothetical protein